MENSHGTWVVAKWIEELHFYDYVDMQAVNETTEVWVRRRSSIRKNVCSFTPSNVGVGLALIAVFGLPVF